MARGGAGKLALKTTTVIVDPGAYTGKWRVARDATQDLIGTQPVVLVPGLRAYGLEVGALGGFSFDIAGDGTVSVYNPLAATGGPGTLRLNK